MCLGPWRCIVVDTCLWCRILPWHSYTCMQPCVSGHVYELVFTHMRMCMCTCMGVSTCWCMCVCRYMCRRGCPSKLHDAPWRQVIGSMGVHADFKGSTVCYVLHAMLPTFICYVLWAERRILPSAPWYTCISQVPPCARCLVPCILRSLFRALWQVLCSLLQYTGHCGWQQQQQAYHCGRPFMNNVRYAARCMPGPPLVLVSYIHSFTRRLGGRDLMPAQTPTAY